MMTEKLKVSREVANAIECVRRECFGFDNMMNIHIKNGWSSEEKMPLSQLTAEELAKALIVGYEVEMTPHEVIATKYIASQQDWVNNKRLHSKGFVEGIELTLNTLGISVKGVNDDGN